MANRVDGGGSSSWWQWCCCCCGDNESEPGETDRLTGTKQEKLLNGPPEQAKPPEAEHVRMGNDTDPATVPKRSHSPGASYSKYQTNTKTPDSPMK
ncbi:MAG: hypothetical protein H7A41_05260 [Chlamydiales bacterium]|nr:hypothetical protein [Chlamydiia bacterium]MCP5504545.1 hypothetical protein [Chlamydiales bacterium]